MVNYYAKRVIEILWEEGPTTLAKSTYNFLIGKTPIPNEKIRQNIRYYKYRLEYDSISQVKYKTIYIKPKDVKNSILADELRDPGIHIVGGDWDRKKKTNVDAIPCYTNKNKFKGIIEEHPWHLFPFKKWTHYDSFVEHFNNNVPWEETDFFKSLMQNMKNNGPKYDTEKKIQERLAFNDKLYKSMKNNGYVTQTRIKDHNNKSFPHSEKDNEISVGITRDGEFVYIRDGACHRFTIAKILHLDSIPVKVKLRHKRWQKLRDDIYNDGLPEEHKNLRDHPDLQDVIEH